MKIKQWIGSMSIKRKIIVYSYLVVTPILLLISVLIFAYNYVQMQEKQNQLGQSRVQNLDTSLGELNQNMLELSTYICINSDISQILTAQDPEKINENSQFWLEDAPMRFIQDTMAIKGYIKTLGIYPENHVMPYLRCMDASSYVPDLASIQETGLYERTVANRGKACWTRIEKNVSELYRANRGVKIVLYREIFDLSKKKRLGFLAIGADAQRYEELCEHTLAYSGDGVIILNAEGELLASGGDIQKEIKTYLLDDDFLTQAAEKKEQQLNYHNTAIYLQQNEKTGMISCILVAGNTITEQLLSVAYAPLLLLLGFLVGLFPVLELVSNIVTRPLGKVEQAMVKFRQGDFEQQVEIASHDEVGEMAECFNQMVVDIRQLIDQNYVMELREKESELTALQAQINPHFLYNTLDSLYWQAVGEEEEEIAENILALSNLFRLVLGEGKGIISVQQEFALVEEYLKIQKMRFVKRLDFQINLEETVRQEMIPKLIIQPFVENAVVHGFENTDSLCMICVEGYRKAQMLVFCIRDTGIGMSREQVQKILDVDDEERYRGQRIGRYAIKNVNERLKLYYQDRYTLTIDSEPGKGTTITIRIRQAETKGSEKEE